jgi:hypothetical protein
MRHRIATENTEAEQLLPPNKPDSSRIGVNYADAYIKPLNATLEDGQVVSVKRKGLKLITKIGEAQGEAIMDRLKDGPDPKDIFKSALNAAFGSAGFRLVLDDGALFLEIDTQ